MLPNVSISFSDGNIGSVTPMDDGFTLIAVTANTSTTTDYKVATYDEYLDKATADYRIETFFKSASGRCNLVYATVPKWETGETINADNFIDAIKKLLIKYKGEIRHVVLFDVPKALLVKLQVVADYATTKLYSPVIFFCSAETSEIETDFTEYNYNRILMVEPTTKNTCLVADVAGRAAAIGVQTSLTKVRDGEISSEPYYDTTQTEIDNVHAEAATEKGLVTVRQFQGKAGYYIANDNLLTSNESDFYLLPRRRTIDKAYRIAYKTLVNYIGDEIPVTTTGGISPVKAKDIENAVEQAIYNQMTLEGNLGVDDSTNNKGVSVYIDTNQNVLATSTLNVVIKVRPYGYASWIEVQLGYSADA